MSIGAQEHSTQRCSLVNDHTHTHIHAHSFSFARCGAERNVLFWVKKNKNNYHCVMFGVSLEENDKLLPLRRCCVAPRWDFNTLSQLINHGGPEKNCFEEVVQRQTLAISTLHFALATHTPTHTNAFKVTV